VAALESQVVATKAENEQKQLKNLEEQLLNLKNKNEISLD